MKPPHKMTVTMTITSVVDSIARLDSDDVSLIASANAIAPRSPSYNKNIHIFL